MSFITLQIFQILLFRVLAVFSLLRTNSLGRSFANEQGEDIIFSKKGEILDPYSSYKKNGVTHLFYAWKFIDGQMLDVTVIDFSKLGFTQMLKAKKGIWNSEKNNWEFFFAVISFFRKVNI